MVFIAAHLARRYQPLEGDLVMFAELLSSVVAASVLFAVMAPIAACAANARRPKRNVGK